MIEITLAEYCLNTKIYGYAYLDADKQECVTSTQLHADGLYAVYSVEDYDLWNDQNGEWEHIYNDRSRLLDGGTRLFTVLI